MDLSGIISITGMSGLHKVIAQTKNGLIVESIVDKKRIVAYSTYKVSALSDISIFSTGEDIPLNGIFQKIMDKHQSGPAIDHKASDEEIKKYFIEVVPEYDQSRVYISDLRKVIGWYNLLQKHDLLKTKPEEKNEDDAQKAKISIDEPSKPAQTIPKVKPKNIVKPAKPANVPKKTQGVRKTGTA